MDPSMSGDPWYPLECICRKIVVIIRSGVVAALCSSSGGVRSPSYLFYPPYARGVSGDVGCLHMSVGLKIGVLWVSSKNYACVIAYE